MYYMCKRVGTIVCIMWCHLCKPHDYLTLCVS